MSWLVMIVIVVVIVAAGLWTLIVIVRAGDRRRRGLSCDGCGYYQKVGDEELCGAHLGLVLAPWTRTCSKFYKERR